MSNYVYLAGPITGLTFGECTDWRDQVRDAVPDFIQTVSPMRGKQRLKEIAENLPILDSYEDNPLTSSKGINMRDYNDVKRSSVIFVNFLGAKRVSIGTVIEIAWAFQMQKPVICVMEPDNIHQHSMLNHACGYIVPTLEAGIQLLISTIADDKQIAEIEK